MTQPRVTDNDSGEITVDLDGRELRGWSYANDGERRAKITAAREYVEGWCDAQGYHGAAQTSIPRATAQEAKVGWRLDFDWVDKLGQEVEKKTGYAVTHECTEEIVLRVEGILSPAYPAWQPIETAPRDGTRILATGGGLGEAVEIVSYIERVGAWETPTDTLDDRDDEPQGYSRPTLWQSLPVSSVSSTEGK